MNAPPPWIPPSPLPQSFNTPRLTLRFWEHGDAASMLECLNSDRQSFLPWLPWLLTDNRTVAECTYSIELFRRQRERESPTPDNFVLGIFDRHTGHAIGGTGLHRMDHPAHHGEIGYYIRPDRRNSGLCTEAVAGLITWAFTAKSQGGWGLRRLDIFCSGRNFASQAVPRKLGLRQEIHQKAKRWTGDLGWDDNLGWGVLAHEWDLANHRLNPAPNPAPV
jgi:ribosomal-protein-serine acetyltransferase